MSARFLLLFVGVTAGVVPWFQPAGVDRGVTPPTWPATFENRPLTLRTVTATDSQWNATFPGSIARFTDGERELIFRFITKATRKVHPAADCFRGLGYSVALLPPRMDAGGHRWSCFTATRDSTRLRVRERITGAPGEEWTDVSAWFWSALLQRSRGPWMAMTIVEDDTGY